MKINKTTIESVANWLLETSSVYYDNALQDSEELLETNPKEFFEILKQSNTENKTKTMEYLDLKINEELYIQIKFDLEGIVFDLYNNQDELIKELGYTFYYEINTLKN